ncbi:13383_t:CDS:2 [Entrophospora sp. SA101]|nr:15412_t:CDS:2 [Entrophospora sp. SA101]CAJ0894506.1 13383_t:CDS:2 [Entrophospora sp. SA101]
MPLPSQTMATTEHNLIAGVDEAGRGALAGPIVVAAVILPTYFLIKSPREVESKNPLQATKEAMVEAALKLKNKPGLCLVDGKEEILIPGVPTQSIIGGDRQSINIAAASIVAKVTRDAIMKKNNKGYPNPIHLQAIFQYGICSLHRKTYEPIKSLVSELGYLGTLPIINPECVELALKLALALQAKISPIIIFDRKIYHYYDLPKGYQITQNRQTLANSGYLPLITSSGIKNIPLRNLQLEEDTAKSFYTEEGIELDFNRAGNPLIELTTEPIFHNSEETILFLRQLQNLLRYLDISEAKMEKGQLRVDLNFSLNLADDYQTPRYEVKNLNSFNAIEKVLKYEINKHHQL